MTNVRAWSQVPNDSHMYVCGDYLHDDEASDLTDTKYSAAIARMKNDGSIAWYISLSGTNLSSGPDQDKCMGVAHNENTNNVAVMV